MKSESLTATKKRRPLSANSELSKNKQNDEDPKNIFLAGAGLASKESKQPLHAGPVLSDGTRLSEKVCTDLLNYLERRAAKPAKQQDYPAFSERLVDRSCAPVNRAADRHTATSRFAPTAPSAPRNNAQLSMLRSIYTPDAAAKQGRTKAVVAGAKR
eukprot:CAMPEP_0172199594 /NCGR_PEP_ID=MMETSP1050-20130122/28783_1 /TAXON_ID=233186 /ORGANISM="Cryptomonas curvata, Strain CCAP979/52" /LENGTH=156 /DNA_ID=CAMNT_0012876651 /DNA_START=33 /DNA_END=499 /DNA_ORIENTATION=-